MGIDPSSGHGFDTKKGGRFEAERSRPEPLELAPVSVAVWTQGRLVNAKRKGARAEHRSMALLEAAGYRCTRSAASLGAWDLVGVGLTDVVLVQVKSGRAPGSMERLALEAFVVPTFVRKLVHVWRDRQRLPDVVEL